MGFEPMMRVLQTLAFKMEERASYGSLLHFGVDSGNLKDLLQVR